MQAGLPLQNISMRFNGDETVKDDMLRRCVRYQNYAEELRIVASGRCHRQDRDAVTRVADPTMATNWPWTRNPDDRPSAPLPRRVA